MPSWLPLHGNVTKHRLSSYSLSIGACRGQCALLCASAAWPAFASIRRLHWRIPGRALSNWPWLWGHDLFHTSRVCSNSSIPTRALTFASPSLQPACSASDSSCPTSTAYASRQMHKSASIGQRGSNTSLNTLIYGTWPPLVGSRFREEGPSPPPGPPVDACCSAAAASYSVARLPTRSTIFARKLWNSCRIALSCASNTSGCATAQHIWKHISGAPLPSACCVD